MYQEGDVIEGLGKIDTNHCGLPWVATTDGLAYGVLQIKGTNLLIDAISGKILSNEELEERNNNPKFDYEEKQKKCQEWRKIHQPFGPYFPRDINTKIDYIRYKYGESILMVLYLFIIITLLFGFIIYPIFKIFRLGE